ncbi:MAG: hypothetical protein J6B59_07245, partial [Alistipes sp.]|nr:hypothetical protein [Alistipes sp.]
ILPAMPTDAYDVDITFCTANEAKQYSVPTFAGVTFERNHRTNIMGSLLTDPGKFVIEIDEEFDDEDYNILPWDGKTVTAPVANAAGVYEISAAAELAYIVQNGGPNTQFILMEDIDMGGYSVPARPADKATNGYIGGMDFNGNGKTIRNYKNGEIGMAGLFPVFAGHTKVYNLTLEGADISPIMGRAATYDGHCFAGALVGQIYGKVTFDKIHVKSSTIVGNNKIGAIAGHVGDNDGHVITNCSSAEDVYLKSCSPADGGSVGGLIGFFESDVTIENCVSKSKVENFMYTPEGKRGCGLLIGSIGATGGVNVTINNCDISGAEFVAVTDPDMVAANKAAEYTSPYGAIIGGTRNDKSVVVIDGNEIMISSTSLADAAKEPGAIINLAAGEYEFPAEFAAGVTLNCAEGTIFNRPEDAPISLDINGATIIGATFKGSNDAGVNLVKSPINGSFKDCTFEGYNTLRYCYPGGLVEFEGCTFKAYEYAVHFDSGSATLSFKNCVFEGTYTVGAGMESIIDECEFRSDLRKMFNIPNFYDKTTVTNSKFVFDGTATVKQSIRLHAANDDASKYVFTNCKVNDEPLADHTNYLAEKLDVGDKLTIDGVTYEYNGNNQFYVDGKLVIVPGLMLDGTTYVVSSVNGFAYLSGKTIPDTVKEIRLDADIDMQGAEFMGMANANSANGSLIFNGNNKTISNIKLAHGGHYGMTDAAGLFDSVTQRWASATFECKDLTMSGVSLANPNAVWSGAIIGYAQCEAGNTFKLTNVKVVDSTLAGKKSIGGFIGMLATPASLVAKDCSISNTAISASEKRAAGFIGCWNGEAPASVTFTNCTVGADVTYTSPSLTGEFIGENVNSTPVTFN